MKKIILTIFVFFTVLGFSQNQDNEIYKIVFSNKSNFDYLNFYDYRTLNKMDTLKVYKRIYLLPSSMFKYDENNYYTAKLADSLYTNDSMHSKRRIYTYVQKISEILSFKEQDNLYNYATLQTEKKVEDIFIDNVKIVQNKNENDYVFCISNIIYSTNKQYAFLRVGVEVADDVIGISTFILKRETGCWKIIYTDKFFNL